MEMDWHEIGEKVAKAVFHFEKGIYDFYTNYSYCDGDEDKIKLMVIHMYCDIFNEVVAMEKNNNQDDWEKVE